MLKIFITFLLLFISTISVSSISGADETPPNIVLISLDTLRADHLGIYGYRRKTSPFIDELASKGAVFTKAVSPSSWTLPVHVSLLTGLYPSTHGVTLSAGETISPSTPLISETLKAHGYSTIAITGDGYVSSAYGFSRGFDTFQSYRNKNIDKREIPSATWKHAAGLVENLPTDKPIFYFIHTYDIHCPYSPPGKYFTMFHSPSTQSIDAGKCGVHYNKLDLNQAQATYLLDRYDGGIRWTDDGFKYFLDKVKDRLNLDNTIFVITSDHGEEFLEHGRIGHQFSLYWELLHVPLLVFGKGIPARTITNVVSTVDVTPTLLNAVGLSFNNSASIKGESLLPLINGESTSLHNYVFSELDRNIKLKSIVTDEEHYLSRSKIKPRQLFNIKRDKKERRNIAKKQNEKVDQYESTINVVSEGIKS